MTKDKENENKKTFSPNFSGMTIGGNFTGGVGSNFSDSASGGTINVTTPQVSDKKTCRICQKSVENHPNECQCEKKDNHCKYCQGGHTDVKDCSCQKELEKQIDEMNLTDEDSGEKIDQPKEKQEDLKKKLEDSQRRLNDSLDFSIADKKEQWNDLLTSIENQVSSKVSKKIIQQLKNYRN